MTGLALQPSTIADPLERARRHVEANLFEPLTLTGLAAVAGLSAYHFSRQFTARFGVSPMAYVRARRLAAAASRLGDRPPPALIDLAFDCGFDSQEAFTRAFKRAFGVPPGRYRRAGAPPPQMEIPMSPSTLAGVQITQSPAPVRKPALRIAGLSRLFDDTTKAAIPDLWTQLIPRLPVVGQAGPETYGVCAAAPEPGSMRYAAGVAIAADAPAPEGMEVFDLAPQAYLVFRQVTDGGDLHLQMQAAAREIWGERLPRSGAKLVQAPDLEVYPPGFRPEIPGQWVEWWVPVEA